MNSTLAKLITSGFKNWKTTLFGLAIAILTAAQTGAFDGQHGQALVASILIAAWGFVSRDANKSSQDSGVRLWWAIPFLCYGLTSCDTVNGVKTFAGLTEADWAAVGGSALKGAATSAAPVYLERRAVNSAKAVQEVQP